LSQIKRKDSHVAQLIEHMDRRLALAKGNVGTALANLTPDERRTVQTELAKVSGWGPDSVRYFLENYFVINTKGEDWEPNQLQTISPFKEPQEIFWADFEYCWSNKIPTRWILLKARQIGWSTLVQATLFQRVIFNKNFKALVMADELVRSNSIFDMSLLAYNNLPYWMRPEMQYANRGKGIFKFDRKDEELRSIRPGLNSEFTVDAGNKPQGSSRGMTLHSAHISEFGLFRNPRIVTSDILPAIPKRNPLVVCVIEGTANEGFNQAYQDMWDMAQRGKGLFRPLFAAWWAEKTYSKPLHGELFEFSKEETELAVKVKEEYGHVVRPEQMAWYREQADQFEATEGDRDRMEQEFPSYPRSAFRSAGLCFFPRKKLSHIEVRDVRKPAWFGDMTFTEEEGKAVPTLVKYPKEMMGEAPLWIWGFPKSSELFYLASDPAQGIPGKDFGGIQVMRVPKKPGERIEQVAEYQGYADPRTLAKIVVALATTYNMAEVAPEANAMTAHLEYIIHVAQYPKIYRWRRADKVTGHWTNFLGWDTNHKSRNDIMSLFRSLLIEDTMLIHSSRLMKECQTFIDDGTGRYEANPDKGFHDDILISAMICTYCLFHMDPNLFRVVDAEPPRNDGRSKQNTDWSLFDEETATATNDFALL
jgi:hypothetical protein